MIADNEPRETAVRVNTLRADPAAILARLRQQDMAIRRPEAPPPLAPAEALIVGGPMEGPVLEAIRSGELTPQARASMAVVEVLDPRPGERVLDLCAAPGIKATQIAARMEDRGEVVAVELDGDRAAELAKNCDRLGAGSVRVVEADAAEADLGAGYDRVLVDPPCSDLGTLASRPDARWRKSPELIERLAGLQARLLERAAKALRPQGKLVYATCTISARENEDLVGDAVERMPGLAADDLGSAWGTFASGRDPRFVQLRPDRDGTAGFFVARLVRTG
jgi:16S rRNA (cytosine967-C5)-methyltransferase